MTCASITRWFVGCAIVAGAFAGTADALVVDPIGPDLERALAIGRRPASDTELAKFHGRYQFAVRAEPVDYAELESIEIITEFRRVVIVAAEHARLNDQFGRGGLQEVEAAVRPWHGTVSIVAHVSFGATLRVIPVVPPVDIVVEGIPRVFATARNAVYSGDSLVGTDVEVRVAATAVGQTTRVVRVFWNGRELGHASLDFSRLD